MSSLKSVTLMLMLSTIYDNGDMHYIKKFTRNISIKQGVLQGIVVEPRVNRALPLVEQYLGIPYAAPPVGELRFMPSGSAPSWFGTKYADSFGPVCPQNFPNVELMSAERREYFERLKEYLQNQSEDCLYLNIYAPFQEENSYARRYPVMVFLHGESFEWNSGNPYDGSVLAAYGKVIVVTLNFRLGILGFLKAGIEEVSRSNFGLVDQIAALQWVKDNIAAFGGDPSAVTLFGHGTGAVCASLLMLSPIVQQEGNQTLFQRAILMGGTALADWALAGNARDVSYQVAQALNCQIHEDFAACLRRKRLDDIMAASAKTPNYTTRFGPIVDSIIVPNDPKKSMTQYNDIFRRFELMYGVTELESIHWLGPVALTHGMLERERDQELRNYLRTRCEMKPELCLARTLAEYTESNGGEFTQNDEKYGRIVDREPDRATLARDALLDILSDARSVAPMVQMGRYHAALNLQSYFYVFTHKTVSKEYIRNKSYNGEELSYVFGVPLDGPRFQFLDQYTKHERLFSEIIMTYFCNFAYTGNPNVPRKNEYLTLGVQEWTRFDVEWPEFDLKQERYLELEVPPKVASHYRSKEVIFWNDIFPQLIDNRTFLPPPTNRPEIRFSRPKNTPPWILRNEIFRTTKFNQFENFNKSTTFGIKKYVVDERPDNIMDRDILYGKIKNSPSTEEIKQSSTSTMNVLMIIGGLFVLLNLILFIGMYYKCYRIKKKSKQMSKHEDCTETIESEKQPKLTNETYLTNGCSLVKMLRKSSKSDDTYEPVKTDDHNSSKFKLSRQMSNSTIDAHTKVRDWITNEIIYKYSPRFFRARNPNSPKKSFPDVDIFTSVDFEKNSTLGKSPTRPVTPSDDQKFLRSPLLKSSSLNSGKQSKPEKVSVAIDATPSGRGPSVLMQRPIELTKSLDYPHYCSDSEAPLRRSVTLEDFSPRTLDKRKDIRKSTTSINLKYPLNNESTVIKIEHGHSKSEPVQDLTYSTMRKLRTFDPHSDVNVTSKDDNDTHVPLSPAEALMTIKRRNFPKVLPDYPGGREALVHKRMSMPVHNHFMPIPELSSFSQSNFSTIKSLNKLPPAPPPRTTSTLGRQQSNSSNTLPACVSEPKLADEPPSTPEPQITSNNLFVGPLIPKSSKENENILNTQPIYESLRNLKHDSKESKVDKPKTIITANPNCPLKRVDPKIVVRPNTTRKAGDGLNKHIPRVVVPDNQPQLSTKKVETQATNDTKIKPEKTDIIERKTNTEQHSNVPVKLVKPKKSQIPTPVKNSNTSLNKESSSSDSSPSEESDTGTVVKKM